MEVRRLALVGSMGGVGTDEFDCVGGSESVVLLHARENDLVLC